MSTELTCLPANTKEILETVFLIDMMALVQRFQNYNCNTFNDLFLKYFNLILNLKPKNSHFIVCVGDRYDFENSLKVSERNRRAKNNPPINYEIQDEFKIPDWKQFIANPNNKKKLLAYFVKKFINDHHTLPEGINVLLAGMAEENSKTIMCSKSGSNVATEFEFTEHEEADTRIFSIIDHFKNRYKRFLIYATDTDIFVLSMYYSSYYTDIEIWMQNNKKFVPCHIIIQSLARIYQKNAENLAGILLAVYCLSGCDSVSFPFRKGKRKALKIAISNEACLDLIHFGSPSLNGYQISETLWTSCRAFFKDLYGRPNFMGNMDELRAHIFPNCKTDIRWVTLNFILNLKPLDHRSVLLL